MKLKQKRGCCFIVLQVFRLFSWWGLRKEEKEAEFYFHVFDSTKGTHNESLLINFVLFMIFPYICILEN